MSLLVPLQVVYCFKKKSNFAWFVYYIFICCSYIAINWWQISFICAEHYQVHRNKHFSEKFHFKGKRRVKDFILYRKDACSLQCYPKMATRSWVFLSYLCCPCCVSAWKMTLVMPAHPSLPLALRKPASSSLPPTHSAIFHFYPVTPLSPPYPFCSSRCDCFHLIFSCFIQTVRQWWWQI